MCAENRKQLVGLLTEDPKVVLEEGAQVVEHGDISMPAKMIGHVTSSYWSAALNRSIAMAAIEAGFGRVGRTVDIPMPGATYTAEVTTTDFYDPDGSRIDL